MTNKKDILFPAVAFHKDQGGLLSLDYKYLIGSKKSSNTSFKGVVLVDSNGNKFNFKGVKPIGNIKFLATLKYGIPMVRLEPILMSDPEKISLEDLKIEIIKTLNEHYNYWEDRYDMDEIKKKINKSKNYKELILIFK